MTALAEATPARFTLIERMLGWLGTINTVGLFCSSLVFAGVTQFGIKRHTDDKVVAAKHGNAPAAREVRGTQTFPKVEG